MPNDPLRIDLPSALFNQHSFITETPPAAVLENNHSFVAELGVAYQLPEGRTFRTVVVKKDEKGKPYLELSE
jgi:hypothetical protein